MFRRVLKKSDDFSFIYCMLLSHVPFKEQVLVESEHPFFIVRLGI